VKIVKTEVAKLKLKDDRKHQVLLGTVEYYIQTGKPVGSSTLREAGFEFLSSATIRNYFANLEEDGLLTQAHISGGRIPTHAAFKIYADHCFKNETSSKQTDNFKHIAIEETKEITKLLQLASNHLSDITNTAVFLSAPRFDHDYIVDIKLICIDHNRVLAIIITDFGVVQTEILTVNKKLTSFSTKRLESYFQFRLNGRNLPENLDREEEELGLKIYNEIMLRYIVGYTNFTDKDILRTGFSKLLSYPDFQDTATLAGSLSLFENVHSMRLMLRESAKTNQMKYWIGDDLKSYTENTPASAVITIPYYINKQSVGAIGLLGPIRMPFRKHFQVLKEFSDAVSESLTRNIYKFKISLRQPEQEALDELKKNSRYIGESHLMLLENHTQEITKT
jgi:heat-inducible transcriptional repressor